MRAGKAVFRPEELWGGFVSIASMASGTWESGGGADADQIKNLRRGTLRLKQLDCIVPCAVAAGVDLFFHSAKGLRVKVADEDRPPKLAGSVGKVIADGSGAEYLGFQNSGCGMLDIRKIKSWDSSERKR